MLSQNTARRCSSRILLFAILAVMAAAPAIAQQWVQVASLPGDGRHHPVNFTLNGYGYAVTGTSPGQPYTNHFYRYDPVANSWAVLPNFPGPARSYSYGGAYGGKGYIGFGQGTAFLNDLWSYDPGTGAWTQLASCPGRGRTHPAFVITDDGKIYVGTGGSAIGNLRDWYVYDIATNQWTQLADLPGPTRHHPYYFNIGRVPYVGFGHGAGIYKDVYRFDPDAGTWTRLADFPGEARVAGTQFTYGGRGYILSGDGDDHGHMPTGELWEYNPDSDQWTQLTPHPGSSRWAPGNFIIGNTLYFMAGLSDIQLEHDMWTYDLIRPAGVGPAGEDIALTLYPNPVSDGTLRVLLPGGPAREIRTVRLIGVDGRSSMELPCARGAIQLPEGLPVGQYALSITMSDGRTAGRRVTILK